MPEKHALKIGDEVVVKIGGRPYTQRVMGFNQDGTVRITSQVWGFRDVRAEKLKPLQDEIDDILRR